MNEKKNENRKKSHHLNTFKLVLFFDYFLTSFIIVAYHYCGLYGLCLLVGKSSLIISLPQNMILLK